MSNILEEYLVKIGVTADMGSFHRAQDAVKGLTGSIEKLGFLLKAGGIVGAFAGVTNAIKEQITAVADLDMEYQKLASTMWTTKESGKALSELPKIMKAKPEDIAWVPELREQFFRLRQEMSEFATPSDAADQLRWIRDIGYEVQSLQLKFMMFREWVVYYLIKYLGPYIEKIQAFFKNLNKIFGSNMANWANKIAYACKKFVDVLYSIYRLGKNIYEVADRFFSQLPSKVKALIPLFAVVGAALMASPFGLFLSAIGGALILLEDFFGYIDGRESSKTLAPMWEMLLKLMNSKDTKNFLDFINDSLRTTIELIAELYSGIKLPELLDMTVEAVGDLASGMLKMLSALTGIFKQVRLGKDDFLGMFRKAGEILTFPLRQMLRWMSLLGKIFAAGGAAIDGNFKEAANILGQAVKNFGRGTFDDFKHMAGAGGSNFGGVGNAGGRDEAISRAASMVDNPTDDLLGNPNGCTYFVQQALGGDNEFMDGSGLWTPNWYDKAKQEGRWHSGMAGIQKGDIIVWDWGADGSGEFGDHVGIYDGQGGCYANSTADQKPVYYDDLYNVGNPAGYIDVGGTFAQKSAPVSAGVQEDVTSADFYIPPEENHQPEGKPGIWDRIKSVFTPTSYAANTGFSAGYDFPMVGGGFGGGVNDNSNNYTIQNCTIITQATDAEGLRNGMTKYFRGFNRGNSQGAVTV